MHLKPFPFLLFLAFLYPNNLIAQSIETQQLDVLNYDVYLIPNLSTQTIKGNVCLRFKTIAEANQVIFDAGNLKVTDIKGNNVKGFTQKNSKLIISLQQKDPTEQEIQIFYEGKPKRGVVFSTALQQVYTVFFSSEWMICNASPNDKASIQLELLIPASLISIANGTLVDTLQKADNKVLYAWNQPYETPAYTYGFTIGTFNKVTDHYKNIRLDYYAHNHTPKEIEKIFQYTGDMLSFFEQKAGIPFPQNTYSQILIGHHYQEMSGFAILKNTYGAMILQDSTETNLISHELAHQWWGNRITCKNWNHFWLNEGFATFLSAAYNEHRFGQQKYLKDINSYFKVYTKIKAKGGDKPLVFKDWSNPTVDDRNLVYFKGAYVLHLLRKELGDDLFWKGILYFTQKYDGQSVVTKDFQLAMETSSNKSLANFFNTWVY